jgi:hypothetical protein
LHAVVEQRQGLLHTAQQGSAGGVQHHSPSPALEERVAQPRFQQTDLLADGAMRQMQRVRGRAQVLQRGDGTEYGEGVQRQAWHSGKQS